MKTKTHNFKIGDLVKIREDVDTLDLDPWFIYGDIRGIKAEIIEIDPYDSNLSIRIKAVAGEKQTWWVKSEWLERV